MAFDFYTEVNYKWIEQTNIPDDLVSYSVFDILEEKIKKNIVHIIKKNKNSDSPFGKFVASIYSKDLRSSIEQLNQFISQLHFNSYEELFYIFGILNIFQLNAPIEFSISNDSRNTDNYAIIIGEPDRVLLKEDYKEKGEYYKRYCEFIENVASESALSKSGAKKLVRFESELSKYYYDSEINQQIERIYNPKTYNQIITEFPLLLYFFKAIDRPIDEVNIIVNNPLLLKETYDLITKYSVNDWKEIIKLNIYISVVTLLPEPFETLSYNFYEKFMVGRKSRKSKDAKLFELCNGFCSETIGKLYIKSDEQIFTKTKKEAGDLLNIVMQAAKKKVLGLHWLSESSRKIAKFKLEKMRSQIGFPELWKEEFISTMDPANFIKNIMLLNKTDSFYNINRLNKDAKSDSRWDNACYDVNAYYYTELNLLCIPMGFLNAPFFSLDQSFLQNLAGLGNIMAHEIAHGFDEEGRKYDEKGNHNPWWISTDIELYNRKTRKLVDFFGKERYYGLKVNGELTLGENLADLGAMAICLEILKTRLSDKDDSQRKAELREFFTWYAKSWAYKETSKKRTQAIKKDNHAPAQIRVNAILRQFGEFYEAFSIKEGDPGFLIESERINIWG